MARHRRRSIARTALQRLVRDSIVVTQHAFLGEGNYDASGASSWAFRPSRRFPESASPDKRHSHELRSKRVQQFPQRNGLACPRPSTSSPRTDPHGRCGITASAVCSVTDTPPTMLVCINQSSYVHDVLHRNGRACINVLGAACARTCARVCGHGLRCSMDERFARCGSRPGALQLPVLDDAIASLEGYIVDSKKVGSHSVLFAQVEHIGCARDGDGLVYFGRQFHGCAPRVRAAFRARRRDYGSLPVSRSVRADSNRCSICAPLQCIDGLRSLVVHEPITQRVDPRIPPAADAPSSVLQLYFDELATFEAAARRDGPIDRALKEPSIAGRFTQQVMAVRARPARSTQRRASFSVALISSRTKGLRRTSTSGSRITCSIMRR